MEGMVDVEVAVVVTMEVEASLEVFLTEVIIIIRLSALLTEAFFCNLSSNFCHEKKSKFWSHNCGHLKFYIYKKIYYVKMKIKKCLPTFPYKIQTKKLIIENFKCLTKIIITISFSSSCHHCCLKKCKKGCCCSG